MATDRVSRPLHPVNPTPRDNVSLCTKVFELLRKRDFDEIITLLKGTLSQDDKKSLCLTFKDDESILHIAVKLRATLDVISALADTCPELLVASRQGSDLYRGQTALHIAITGCDIETAELLLDRTKTYNVLTLNHLLGICATGSRFNNTVMLGEIPLSVAALTLNADMFVKILEFQNKIDAVSSHGENVCHCLIRYAHLYPEKLADVRQMLTLIANLEGEASPRTGIAALSTFKLDVDEGDRHNVHIWLMKDDDGLNPLQLAARLGQQQIFKMITEMKGVYCYVNSEDGLFDVELYDVSEIDDIAEIKETESKQSKWVASEKRQNGRLKHDTSNAKGHHKNIPILEMIFNSDPKVVFKFIQMSPLRYVINRKWSFYRWFYRVWGALHILFMVGFTIYSVRRSAFSLDGSHNTTTFIETITNEIPKDGFVTFYLLLSLAVSITLIAQEIVRIVKGRMPWTWSHLMNCYHNGPFRLMLLLFALLVLIDIVWYLVDPCHGNYFMVMSMVVGWWFLVFFLRGFRQFSFFTVMIQKIIVGDMFRFSIIIGMELVAFTTAIFIVFQGTHPSDENVTDYAKLVVEMFKMMFGLTSLDVLFEARHPWFAVCMYTAFVLLTYVLMINSLIAMMSNTCSVVSQNRDVQYRVQQLSIVLFFESIFPARLLHTVGEPRICKWYDSTTGRFTSKTRYFMEVRSLKEVTRSRSRIRQNEESLLESILNTLKSIPLPSLTTLTVPRTVSEDKHKANEIEDAACIADARENVSSEPVDASVNEKRKKKKKKKKPSKWALPQIDAVLAAEYFEHGSHVDGVGHGVNRVTPDFSAGLGHGVNRVNPDLSPNRALPPKRITLDINYINN